MRKVFSRIAVGFLLACPFIVTTLLLAEVWLRWTTNLPFLSRTSCFTQNPREAPAFRENCRELLRTPQAPVEFQTNAEGFRDRPREFFAKGAIGVLGDSYVEGFWLPDNSGPVRSLERAMGGAIPFLNLGIRGSGPSQQAIRFFRAVKSGYRFRGLIWFLNPSDPVDERYFLAQNPGFRIVDGNWPDLKPLWEPSRTYWIWTHLSLFFRDKVYLFLYMAEKWIKQTWQAKRVEGSVFNDNLHCGSLLEVTRYAKASSLPLIFVVTPHGHGKQNRLYMGTSLRGGDFERMLNCVRNEKVEMIDLRKDLEGDLDWYWKNDWHFNEKGVMRLVDLLAPGISRIWSKDFRWNRRE